MKMKEYILHSNKSKGVAYHLNIFNQFYTSYLGTIFSKSCPSQYPETSRLLTKHQNIEENNSAETNLIFGITEHMLQQSWFQIRRFLEDILKLFRR